jgi:mRNA-degrading endonuclease RelE of RelBE toxin-antitoxin system
VTRFRVQLTRVAAKDLDALDEVVREAVVADLARLSESPIDRPPRVKRLKGFRHPLYRVRSGDHRIVYRIDETLVTILRVIDRRVLERSLRSLRKSQR